MSSGPKKMCQHPINWLQRIALYVTRSNYYLVGSNNTQTAFKVLKIDRNTNNLDIVDDGIEYNYSEIRDLLIRIDLGNKPNAKTKGVEKTVSSFGLVGFVKFLHGYYLILITKRRRVANIGYHSIFKVEETKLVYIPNVHPTEYQSEESRYFKAFNNVDLTRNFYFSYSYDLTHTLQYNLIPVRMYRFRQNHDEGSSKVSGNTNNCILVKSNPCYRFAWNHHLINIETLHDDWKLYLIHGFIEQANISVYSRSIYITLIARRSRLYAGTRFLKRGVNLDGDVANEVETEQIVHDNSVSSFIKGAYTSFVQMRGSLPDRWSQNSSKTLAKPQITQDFVDPYHKAPAKHFDDLLRRYGSPVIVLNLVKRKEKKPHESLLDTMLINSVGYLNQFLPNQHVIRHIAFDMARCNKSIDENVMTKLGKIGFNILKVTGIFQSWPKPRRANQDNAYTLLLRQKTFSRMPSSSRIGGYRLTSGQCLQNGIVRVNCVDSLDRTNTAQFVLGKVALAFQLQALGVLIEPCLEFDTDAVRLLEQLYEDHGDTIALQYGGSQLVHRVKTYRKIAPFASQSTEIVQTLSRYYSNTFSDAEKQNLINIFLGLRQPSKIDPWYFVNDYYLHNQILMKPFSLSNETYSYTNWYNKNLLKCLPRALEQYDKESNCYTLKLSQSNISLKQRIDFFKEAYRPYEMSCLSSVFHSQMLNTVKDYMPTNSTNLSPFCIRLQPKITNDKHTALAVVAEEEDDDGNGFEPSVSSKHSSAMSSGISTYNSANFKDEDGKANSSTVATAGSELLTTFLSRSNASCLSLTQRRASHSSTRLHLANYSVCDNTISEFDSMFEVKCNEVTNSDVNLFHRYISLGKESGEFVTEKKQKQTGVDSLNSQYNLFCDMSDGFEYSSLTFDSFVFKPLNADELHTFNSYVSIDLTYATFPTDVILA